MPKQKIKSNQSYQTKKMWITLGVVSTIVLLAVSGISWWGYKFSTNMVRDQMTAQKIYFPPKGSPALDPATYPNLQQYAGQLVDDGPKARAYANGFIGKHLEEIADGKTYAEVSALAREKPDDQKLQGQKLSLFQGETLRGLLLTSAYAYWTLGTIAKVASLAALLLGAVVSFVTFKCWVSLKQRS